METIIILLLAYQVKHFLCDYPLQTEYMLGKFKREGWILPLSTHAGIHALGTAIIAFLFLPLQLLVFVVLLDFIAHFIIDRIKAHPDVGGQFKPDQPYFWWTLGADQMAHHLTHYFIIYLIWSQL